MTDEVVLDRKKTSREQELHSADPVHDEYANWDNDLLLDTKDIPPRDGYVQRWVRTHIKGVEDQGNIFKSFNKGWRPRQLSSVPKGQYVMHVTFQDAEVIGIHGMILMERPLYIQQRAKEAVQEATDMQMRSVRNDLYKVHDERDQISRPDFEVKSEVSKGRGRAPTVDD